MEFQSTKLSYPPRLEKIRDTYISPKLQMLGQQDKLYWDLTTTSLFTTSSCYFALTTPKLFQTQFPNLN